MRGGRIKMDRGRTGIFFSLMSVALVAGLQLTVHAGPMLNKAFGILRRILKTSMIRCAWPVTIWMVRAHPSSRVDFLGINLICYGCNALCVLCVFAREVIFVLR